MLGLAINLHKICPNLTIKTLEWHQLTSLQCLYCKLYTHFRTYLFSFCTVDLEHAFACWAAVFLLWRYMRHIEAAMWNCSKKTPAKEIFVSKARGEILQISTILNVLLLQIHVLISPNDGYFYTNRYGSSQRKVLQKIIRCF